MNMSTLKKSLAAVASVLSVGLAASSALAWVPNQIATRITDVIVFQNGENRVILKAASGDLCYFDSEAQNGKALMTAVMAVYLSGRSVNLTCHDATVSIGGLNAHLVHRFWIY